MPLLDVRHQVHAQTVLQRALARERVPHAYLFYGPDGVGKERLAVGLAQRLLCTQPVRRRLDAAEAREVGPAEMVDACGTCKDCHTIAVESHPDVRIVHRHQHREHPDAEIRKRTGIDIGIEVIRHFLVEKSMLTSMRGRGKVFIVRQADRITAAAQNAMLKTLEEPPGGTYIILLASAAERLLPTVLSRCQAVRFDLLPTAFVEQKLAELAPEVPHDQRAWYARVGDGSVGQARQWIEDAMFAVNENLLPLLSAMVESGAAADAKQWTVLADGLGEHYAKRDKEISDTEATRQALKAVLKLAATWYADVVRCAAGGPAIVNARHAAGVAAAARRLGVERAVQSVRRFAKAERHLDQNVNTQLAIESLLIDLARIARGMATGE